MKKIYNHEVMSQLGRLYYRLKDDLYSHINQNQPCICFDDLFQDTILLVASDSKARNLNDTELKAYFKYRFNMIEYRANKEMATTLKVTHLILKETIERY